ncbi:MAG: Tad domain-containing protein [Sphingomonadales bacterium]
MIRRFDTRSGVEREVHTGILRRLLRNTAGNTLTIMAAAVIPLAALVGGAVDMSRLYLAKTRLQQACDAGALAGRKVMGGGTWTANNSAANTAALTFFDANFKDGSYGTSGRSRSFGENAGKVTGNASVTVPMTIMRVFNQASRTINVSCDAEMRLPNTDVMFVLDTTGSMGQAIPGDTQTKIDGLKVAVKCFYEILQKLDTNASCGSTPSGGISNQVQVRFGFMPFATNVNVGKLLPTTYLADTWSYQSRKAITTTQTYYTFDAPGTVTQGSSGSANTVYGSWSTTNTYNNVDGAWCLANEPADTTPQATGSESAPYNQQTTQSGSTQTVTWQTSQPYDYYEYQSIYSSKFSRCTYQRRHVTYNLIRYYQRIDQGTEQTGQVFSQWQYDYIPLNVSGLKNGTSWNDSVSLPIGNTGTQKTVSWGGCIEERTTASHSSYDPIPSDTYDLNIDMVPNPGDPNSLWGPALPGAVYLRGVTGTSSSSLQSLSYPALYNTNNYTALTGMSNVGSYYACPTEAVKLQQWPNATDFDTYVDSLTPGGNTYHDIGLLWGARFMSPTGIFASENATTPQGGDIQRHLIFMTDGEVCTSRYNYQAYGFHWLDRRTVGAATVPTDGCSTDASGGGNLTAQVIARYSALCTAVKNMNITLWVVYFGSPSAADATRMSNCASSGRFYVASSNASLLSTFNSIAAQISQLRLTS